MKRGDIHYIEDTRTSVGSEQRAGRPAIIVSNDANNKYSETVEVVFLTTAPKHDLPTHVTIRGTHKVSTALCEQITSVSIERIGSYLAACTDKEMEALELAMAISLDIPDSTPQETPQVDALCKKLEAELTNVKLERDTYKRMYDDIINKLVK